MPLDLDYEHHPREAVVIERDPPDGPASSLSIRVRVSSRRREWNLWLTGAMLLVLGLPGSCVFFTLLTINSTPGVYGRDPTPSVLGLFTFVSMIVAGAWFLAKGKVLPPPDYDAALRFTPVGVDASDAAWLWPSSAEQRLGKHLVTTTSPFLPTGEVRAVEVVPAAAVGDPALPNGCLLRVRGTGGTASMMVPAAEPAVRALAAEARRVLGLEASDGATSD